MSQIWRLEVKNCFSAYIVPLPDGPSSWMTDESIAIMMQLFWVIGLNVFHMLKWSCLHFLVIRTSQLDSVQFGYYSVVAFLWYFIED